MQTVKKGYTEYGGHREILTLVSSMFFDRVDVFFQLLYVIDGHVGNLSGGRKEPHNSCGARCAALMLINSGFLIGRYLSTNPLEDLHRFKGKKIQNGSPDHVNPVHKHKRSKPQKISDNRRVDHDEDEHDGTDYRSQQYLV